MVPSRSICRASVLVDAVSTTAITLSATSVVRGMFGMIPLVVSDMPSDYARYRPTANAGNGTIAAVQGASVEYHDMTTAHITDHSSATPARGGRGGSGGRSRRATGRGAMDAGRRGLPVDRLVRGGGAALLGRLLDRGFRRGELVVCRCRIPCTIRRRGRNDSLGERHTGVRLVQRQERPASTAPDSGGGSAGPDGSSPGYAYVPPTGGGKSH